MAVNSFNAQNPPVTTKGDLFTFSTIPTRLAVGTTNGHVLQVDSTTATGLKWAAPSSGGLTWSLLNAGGTALTGASTITISGISNQKQILILIADASKSDNSESFIEVRINGDTAANYSNFGAAQIFTTTYDNGNFTDYDGYSAHTAIRVFRIGDSADDQGAGSVFIDQADTTGWKRFIAMGSGREVSGTNHGAYFVQGFYEGSAAITSVSVRSQSGSNFDAGTVYVLGAA